MTAYMVTLHHNVKVEVEDGDLDGGERIDAAIDEAVRICEIPAGPSVTDYTYTVQVLED